MDCERLCDYGFEHNKVERGESEAQAREMVRCLTALTHPTSHHPAAPLLINKAKAIVTSNITG